jgi:hypothetical protein
MTAQEALAITNRPAYTDLAMKADAMIHQATGWRRTYVDICIEKNVAKWQHQLPDLIEKLEADGYTVVQTERMNEILLVIDWSRPQ